MRALPALLAVVLAVSVLPAVFAEGSGSPVPGRPVVVDGGKYFNLTPAELRALLTRKDFFFVNTHIPYQGEIAGTDASIPFDQTRAEIRRYPADKAARIVLYCRSGRMSDIAARELVKLGYTNVFNLDGGMIAWEQAGYPLKNAPDSSRATGTPALGSRMIPLLYWPGASRVDATRKAPSRRNEEKILIIKTGSTLPSLKSRKGDFEDWIIAGMGVSTEQVTVVDVTTGSALPENGSYAGVVITGSHSMVTDRPRWSERTASWLALEVASGTPTLGICYGHQLLGQALGGLVQQNPLGWELGTVEVTLREPGLQDEILGGCGATIRVHVSHAQSVLRLPKNAVRLATNARDINQAFRVGPNAWGVQFHPEFDVEIVQAYIEHCRARLVAEGQDPDRLMREAADTETGTEILTRFAKVARGS